jgi:predicted RNA-binding protein associated with RNAse of E/G family
MIVLEHAAQPSRPLTVDGEEVMAAGYRAVWFLFKGRPYDIGRFYRPDGVWTGYYVDILEPLRWDGEDPETLEPLVDLFLDLWICPDGSYLVLDEDELDEALQEAAITEEQGKHARDVLRELIERIGKGEFLPRSVSEWDVSNPAHRCRPSAPSAARGVAISTALHGRPR